MTPTTIQAAAARREGRREGPTTLAETMLALQSTADLGAISNIAGRFVVESLKAREYRLLRLDPRSGALRVLDEFGIETPYLADPGGPIEQALRLESAVFDEGTSDQDCREAPLWTDPPGALATVPLDSCGTLRGLLLVAFEAPHRFDSEEQTFLHTVGGVLALALERSELQRAVAFEQKRAAEFERRLHDDEETSSQLMSVVAHEIRSPLTAIKAYAEALLDNPPNVHVQRDRFLGIINSECDRLTRLVADILDLSRLESGRRPLRLARFAVESLVLETLETVGPVARSQQIGFDVQVEPDLVVEGDPDLLRRLLLNLVGNAVKYSPKSGRVAIEARSQGEDWVGSIEDQGPGIPVEDLTRVFERFFRARPGGDEEVEGHGLGLAIARGITEVHGGRIWAQSRAPSGTRMCFTLPMRQLASPRARRIARLISSRADVRQLYEEMVDLVAAMMDAEIVSLALVDSERGDLVIAASRGLDGFQLLGRRTSVRSGVSGSVAAWGKPLLVNNIETDRRFERLSNPQYTTKSLLCVPLRVAGEVLGVFNVTNKHTGAAFNDDDLSVLTTLIDRVGRTLERVWAHGGSDRVMGEALSTIRSMTRLKREYLLGGRDAVHLATALARELGMSESDIDLLAYVVSIHDVGMIRLKSRLDTAEDLDPESRKELERHPEVSLDILRPLGYLARVSELILTHHERWDGTGYPRGLKGEEIPLGSRILAVVDAYDSMVKGRPYRAQRTREESWTELSRNSGTQFDPRVVEAFLRLPAIQRGEG